jgi:hypothetical protein
MRTINFAINFLVISVLLVAGVHSVTAQSGGAYDNWHNVIAGGGGSKSVSGSLSIDGTIGQAQAGTVSTGGNFDLRGGFWAYQSLAPTAAPVSVSGRMIFNTTVPKCRVRLVLVQLSSGIVRATMPNQLGYYRFEDLEIGTYLLRAESTNCQFTPSQQFLNLLDNLLDADFSQIPS